MRQSFLNHDLVSLSMALRLDFTGQVFLADRLTIFSPCDRATITNLTSHTRHAARFLLTTSPLTHK